MILRLGPFTPLTDPNFLHAGQRAHLGYGLWSKPLQDAARSVEQLPRPGPARICGKVHDPPGVSR